MTEEPLLVELVRLPRDVVAETIMDTIRDMPPVQQMEFVALLSDVAKLLPKPLSDIAQGAVFTVASRVPGGEYVIAASMLWGMVVSLLSIVPVASITAMALALSKSIYT